VRAFVTFETYTNATKRRHTLFHVKPEENMLKHSYPTGKAISEYEGPTPAYTAVTSAAEKWNRICRLAGISASDIKNTDVLDVIKLLQNARKP
jgi:hypothetical protein